MVVGLVNSLQCSEHDALRIALFELINNSDREFIDSLVNASSAGTKITGHTSRDRSLSLSLPGQEKADAEEFADHLGLTPKELLRLAIIHLAKGIRTEKTTKLTNSRKISQDTLAKEWSKANKGKPASEKTKALKEVAAQAYKEAADLGEEYDYELYKERGRMMKMLNWEGVGRVYANTNPDGSGKPSLQIIDAMLAIQNPNLNWAGQLEDEMEQIAEDLRKTSYLEAIKDNWSNRYEIDLTDDELEFFWEEFLERQSSEKALHQLDEPYMKKKTDLDIEKDLSYLDQQPDEITRDYYMRISGPQIVERLEQAEEPIGAENQWWLQLTGRQYEAAEAIQLETNKEYHHITLAEIEEHIRNSR